jgi:hypothetical protein
MASSALLPELDTTALGPSGNFTKNCIARNKEDGNQSRRRSRADQDRPHVGIG